MATHKNIFWRKDMSPDGDGNSFANVHLMVGYNQATITDLQSMAEELRKTFPQAKDSEIRCGHVIESTYCKNFTLITWNAHIPEGDYPDWRQVKNGRMDYSWV